jgi:hypothetical protein
MFRCPRNRVNFRSLAADLHLLSSEPVGRGLRRANLARSVRAHDRSDRPCLLETAGNSRPTHRAGKGQDSRCGYSLPDELPARLRNVLRVIYLVFNEGYSASSGEDLLKPDLSTEAIRLARLLSNLLPEPEVLGSSCCKIRGDQQGSHHLAISSPWRNRIAGCGIAQALPKAAALFSKPCGRAVGSPVPRATDMAAQAQNRIRMNLLHP